ncbi:copper resistance protein B [Qipengyuania aquimaris]|uniref:copper resistance protein B n=1 Tax=Qipengyuania aquimaris TaxID=255984 RepID=UPI001FD070CD|nr:copper resistance protein B [Qipengyuania aquimaris]UOR15095.1 copper resistance protein B [Qipengyuania aquimaris]
MRLALTLALPLMALALPAAAQDHSAHAHHQDEAAQEAEKPDHSSHEHPVEEAVEDHSGHAMPDHSAHAQHEEKPQEDHSGHAMPDHSAHGQHEEKPQEDHSGHAMMADHSMHQVGDVPQGPPPPEAFEGPQHAADAIFGAEAMAEARANNHATHGDMLTGTLMAERLEARFKDGEEGFLWDLQGWYGGDIDKFVLKSEGEGEFGGEIEDAEIQALWGHAIGPFFDLQAGARIDLEPDTRSHLVLGIQGLAPYMWHVDGALFLSDRGDLTSRIEGEYDQKITQALILQPRVELELSAQDIPERAIGAGLTKIEPGLRLRYEIAREFAPYVGVEYEAKLGETADIARAAGEDPDALVALVGIRAWF